MKRHLLLAALLMSLTIFPAHAATHVVALDATWPPFEFLDANGELVGYTIDLITAVSREGGFSITPVIFTWDGIFARLNQGKFDILASSITITEERRKQIDFSLPYFETSQHLLLPAASDAKSFGEMKGKVLGAQTGTMGQKLVNSHTGFTSKPYDDLIDAITELAEGKIEGVVCDYPVARYYANSETFKKNIKLALFTITGEKEFYGFAVRKGNKNLLTLVNNGLAEVKRKGIDREIYTKWFGVDSIAP